MQKPVASCLYLLTRLFQQPGELAWLSTQDIVKSSDWQPICASTQSFSAAPGMEVLPAGMPVLVGRLYTQYASQQCASFSACSAPVLRLVPRQVAGHVLPHMQTSVFQGPATLNYVSSIDIDATGDLMLSCSAAGLIYLHSVKALQSQQCMSRYGCSHSTHT